MNNYPPGCIGPPEEEYGFNKPDHVIEKWFSDGMRKIKKEEKRKLPTERASLNIHR